MVSQPKSICYKLTERQTCVKILTELHWRKRENA